jgi:hypothetical protein
VLGPGIRADRGGGVRTAQIADASNNPDHAVAWLLKQGHAVDGLRRWGATLLTIVAGQERTEGFRRLAAQSRRSEDRMIASLRNELIATIVGTLPRFFLLGAPLLITAIVLAALADTKFPRVAGRSSKV